MRSIPQFFEDSVARFGDNKYMWEKRTDRFTGSTFKEIREQVHLVAAGFLSLGIRKGDRLALLSEGRNDWLVCELGMLYTGAVNVPLSTLLSEQEIKFRLSHSEARMIVVSRNQSHKLENIMGDLRNIEKIILLDEKTSPAGNEMNLTALKEDGRAYLQQNPGKLEETWKSVHENDYANISYTSGTTAEPKGIILTHLNYYANVQQAYSLMDVPPSWRIFLFLPWDHSFAHSAGLYCFMGKGAGIGSLQSGKTPMETLKNIPLNIREFKPEMMFSVPAFSKNMRKNIESAIEQKGSLIRSLFRHALKISYAYNREGYNKGRGFRFLWLPLIKLYDLLIFKKVRQQLGGKLQYFIGGGALLDIELQRFFYAIGIPIYQGYGLSEASPIISINTPYRHKLGSSGIPVKFLELKICDEEGRELPQGEKGEIVVKGENIMAGYWKNPEATKDALKDGWLYTGDMGYVDKDGFLYVLGRFKSLLISDDGEKFSPEGIEEAFVDQSPCIHQCMLYNNQNPYTTVLLVPSRDAILKHLEKEGLAPGSTEGREEALRLLQAELQAYRTGGRYSDMFPQRWLPASVGILSEEFSQANLQLNSLMKMVRGKIVDRYKPLIDFLYTPGAKNIMNEKNMEEIGKLLS